MSLSGVSAQVRIDDSLPPWFRADIFFNQLNRLCDRTSLTSGAESHHEQAFHIRFEQTGQRPKKSQMPGN
jgi:hypothetical protein